MSMNEIPEQIAFTIQSFDIMHLMGTFLPKNYVFPKMGFYVIVMLKLHDKHLNYNIRI